MIICVKCAQANDDHARTCKRCGWKLQSRRTMNREGRVDMPKPLGKEAAANGFSLVTRAFEVVGVCLLLMGSVAYGMVTDNWWPVGIIAPLGLALLAWRRKWRE